MKNHKYACKKHKYMKHSTTNVEAGQKNHEYTKNHEYMKKNHECEKHRAANVESGQKNYEYAKKTTTNTRSTGA